MKRLVLLLAVVASLSASAQTGNFDNVNARLSFKLAGKSITFFDDDTAFNADNSRLPTQYAVYHFLLNRYATKQMLNAYSWNNALLASPNVTFSPTSNFNGNAWTLNNIDFLNLYGNGFSFFNKTNPGQFIVYNNTTGGSGTGSMPNLLIYDTFGIQKFYLNGRSLIYNGQMLADNAYYPNVNNSSAYRSGNMTFYNGTTAIDFTTNGRVDINTAGTETHIGASVVTTPDYYSGWVGDKLVKVSGASMSVGNADSLGRKHSSYYASIKYVDSLSDLRLSRFINYPDSFPFRPFPIAIDKSGKAIAVGFDVKNEWAHLLDSGKITKYYVDPRNGNDANSGLSFNVPKKNVKTLINTAGKKVIYIAPMTANGVYYREETGLSSAISKSKVDTTIIIGQGYAPLSNFYTPSQFTWTDTAGMSKAISSKFGAGGRDSVGDVVDFSKKDTLGDRVMYKRVHNIQSCKDTAGTFYCDSVNIGALYVHTIDGRSPDSLLRIGNASQYNMYYSVDSGYIAYDNVTFYGGIIHTYLSRNKVNNLDVRFLNCSAAYTGTQVGFPNAIQLSNIKDWGYGFTVRGIKSIYNFYPVGHTVEADGGHYEDTIVGGQWMNVVEFGANFYNCGNVIKTFNVGGDASNGSSSHGGSNIIRLNCNYASNRGQNVSDIGYNRSMIIACSSFNSTSSGLSSSNPGDRRKADFGVNDGQMYLFNCEAHGSLYSVQTKSLVPIFADGQAIISNSIFKGVIQ